MLHILNRLNPTRAEWALIAVTAVWGGTFLVVHLAMDHSGPMFFVGLRFLTAGLVSIVIFRKILHDMTRRELIAGSLIGLTIFLGYGLQTFGLQTITASASAFITALYVPLVPLLHWMIFRKPPGKLVLAGVAVAFIGLVLVANPFGAGLGFGIGEIATVISTVAIAAEILLIGFFAGNVDAGRVTVVQLIVAGALGFLVMPIVDESAPAFSWVWVLAAGGLGAASCLIQLTMNWAQRTVSPTRATLIYAGEPVWGGIIGRIAGERLPGLALLGGALIVVAVVMSELQPRSRRDALVPSGQSTEDDGPVR